MAHVMMRSLDGYNYQITTSDPALLAAWFLEHIGKAVHPPYADHVELTVYPGGTQNRDGTFTSDWPFPHGESYYMSAEELQRVADMFTSIAEGRKSLT